MCTENNGLIVWARSSKKYWPGVIVDYKCINFREPKPNNSVIFWFGDYRASEISNSNIVDFPENFISIFHDNEEELGKRWMTGVVEAIYEFGFPHTNGLEEDELITWGKENIPKEKARYYDLSPFVKDKLNIICNNQKKRRNNVKKNPTSHIASLLSKYKKGAISSLTICLACYSDNIAEEHPLFQGFLCRSCIENYKESYFATGYDLIKYFCVICASSGDVIVCEKIGCNLVYCYKCIDDFATPRARREILKINGWRCFACDPESKFNGILRVKKERKQNILSLYNCGDYMSSEIQRRRPLRVLSLFDGIGTGLTALVRLNIPVEAYFSSEIDPCSISVISKNYPSGITYMGDVKEITEEDIQDILPIDLVFGGSPCNDLSLVNPARKGLYDANGTGILFFEFYRILKIVQTHNRRRVYWLFENVASMSPSTQQSITRFLQCEPVLIDAACVSPMYRPRLFWGNLPSLQCQSFSENSLCLQDDLLPGRKAVVDKLQTVTTNATSLQQGPTMKLPVLSPDGIQDNVDIRELERVYGFPNNYTKVSQNSPTVRQTLLGKAWSVKVIMIILHCLREIY